MLEIIVLSSKAFSSFIHQTLDLSWYLGHRPVFLAASSMFAIRGQSVAFQVLKLGTHEDTHESGADAGRLKGVLREAPDHRSPGKPRRILSLLLECARHPPPFVRECQTFVLTRTGYRC